ESNQQHVKKCNTIEVNEIEMGRISNFKSLPEVIALAEIPVKTYNPEEIKDSLSVILNGIQDPGNIGTILRVCDWFGIRNIFCDHDCANIFNPKSVQASMGAIFRMNVFYLDLVSFIPRFTNPDFPCYGTFLEGENIYRMNLQTKGFIVMGNEGNGIRESNNVEQNNNSQFCTQSLFDRIPERGSCHWHHPFGIQTNRI
ncbi:MAG: TrmH family RNA methyltransferase, partial [Butyricimonas faecihominis]